MKILRLPSLNYLFTTRQEPASLRAGWEGAELLLDEGTPRLRAYGTGRRAELRSVPFGDVGYYIELNAEGGIDFPSLRDGRCVLRDRSGNRLELAPELLYLLIHTSLGPGIDRRRQGPLMIGNIYRLPRPLRRAFFIGNLETGELRHSSAVKFGIHGARLLGETIVGYDESSSAFTCLDLELSVLWTFKPDQEIVPKFVTGPEVYQDRIIQSFGHSRVTRSPGDVHEGMQLEDKRHFHDGELYALAQADGSVRWHVAIPKSIDNMVLVGDRLYLCSVDEIHVLDAATGTTERVVETGLSHDYDRSLYASSLHVEGNHLYFCHPVDACLLVYSLDDLGLVRRVDIPAPFSVQGFECRHEATGRLYFKLRPRPHPEYYHMWPILEIDSSDLQGELEIDSGPPVDIALRPSGESRDLTEVWIDLRDVPLDQALLYGELHAEDQAYYHGSQGPALHDEQVTESFNGKVHFRYSGSDRAVDEVRDKLAVMEKRFAEWSSAVGVFAGADASVAVSLDAEYLG